MLECHCRQACYFRYCQNNNPSKPEERKKEKANALKRVWGNSVFQEFSPNVWSNHAPCSLGFEGKQNIILKEKGIYDQIDDRNTVSHLLSILFLPLPLCISLSSHSKLLWDFSCRRILTWEPARVNDLCLYALLTLSALPSAQPIRPLVSLKSCFVL